MILGNLHDLMISYGIGAAVAHVGDIRLVLLNNRQNQRCAHSLLGLVFACHLVNLLVGSVYGAADFCRCRLILCVRLRLHQGFGHKLYRLLAGNLTGVMSAHAVRQNTKAVRLSRL